MMLPVIAIVGRPNVGKSTLFNQLTRSRDAIVADIPGVTRDRQYGEGCLHEQRFIVIDTGGVGEETHDIEKLMASQSWQAVIEANIVIFLVDGRAGLTPADEEIAHKLRQQQKHVQLVVNKTDGVDEDIALGDFYQLGFEQPIPIAAAHGRGVLSLLATLLSQVKDEASEEQIPEQVDNSIKIAIIGRPNVGKSTLVNRLLGEERVLVYDAPGTTRSSIFIPYTRREQDYTLIDTAGIRRRTKVTEMVEKFSIIKTLRAIETANVVILVINARDNISEQDLRLLGFILEAGRAVVIAVNKWDNMAQEEKQRVKYEIGRRLNFIDFAKIHFISALHGTGVGDLYQFVDKAYQSAMLPMQTNDLTKLLMLAIEQHQPPLVKGRRVKLRYAHPGGHNPPVIVIHGKQTQSLPQSYTRYLHKFFIDKLGLQGTPIRIELKTDDNPYEGIKNKLTPRQVRKRKRMTKFYKKKDK